VADAYQPKRRPVPHARGETRTAGAAGEPREVIVASGLESPA
jgi:hypothetical protein